MPALHYASAHGASAAMIDLLAATHDDGIRRRGKELKFVIILETNKHNEYM